MTIDLPEARLSRGTLWYVGWGVLGCYVLAAAIFTVWGITDDVVDDYVGWVPVIICLQGVYLAIAGLSPGDGRIPMGRRITTWIITKMFCSAGLLGGLATLLDVFGAEDVQIPGSTQVVMLVVTALVIGGGWLLVRWGWDGDRRHLLTLQVGLMLLCGVFACAIAWPSFVALQSSREWFADLLAVICLLAGIGILAFAVGLTPALLIVAGAGSRPAPIPIARCARENCLRFERQDDLRTARADHTVTILPDGAVLVAGGVGADGRVLDDAEILRRDESGCWYPHLTQFYSFRTRRGQMRRICFFGVLVLFFLAVSRDAGAQCTSNADCRGGRVCRDGRCANPACTKDTDCAGNLVCMNGACVVPSRGAPPPTAAQGQPPPPANAQQGAHKPWRGTHGFVGGVLGVGPALIAGHGWKTQVDGTVLGALRAGVFFGHFELSVELAPVTWLPFFDAKHSVLSVSGTIGGVIPLTDRLFWPIRIRFGLVAVNTPDIMTLVGGDLLGLGYRFKNNWTLEVALPSFRYAGNFGSYNVWAWPIAFTVYYVF